MRARIRACPEPSQTAFGTCQTPFGTKKVEKSARQKTNPSAKDLKVLSPPRGRIYVDHNQPKSYPNQLFLVPQASPRSPRPSPGLPGPPSVVLFSSRRPRPPLARPWHVPEGGISRFRFLGLRTEKVAEPYPFFNTGRRQLDPDDFQVSLKKRPRNVPHPKRRLGRPKER